MRAWFALLVVTPLLAGCFGGDEPGALDPGASDSLGWTPCEHPWPCADGSEWPTDLEGPFNLGKTLTDPIESHDGTPLETTIYIPDLPEGVKAPVALWSQPYTGGCASSTVVAYGCLPASDSEAIYEGAYPRLDPSLLVENGFAVAIVNVRGTGNSGGCFQYGGHDVQLDQVHLVDWLADQPWSNGRVAMYGHSHHSYTAFMAAVQATSALKTVVVGGLHTDLYTIFFTPQGAPVWFASGAASAAFSTSLNFVPPLGGDPEHATVDHAPHYLERLCPEIIGPLAEPAKGQFTDLRDPDFWDERRLITRFPNITASVLVAGGLNEDAHFIYQEDDVWNSLPVAAPKRMILGQWGHDLPPPPMSLENAPFGSDWYEDTALPWLAYWLKGIGDPGELHLDTVHYQDDDEAWYETSAWPPVPRNDEVLYLDPSGTLSPSPEAGEASFSTVPSQIVGLGTCPGTLPDGIPGTALTYLSEPVDEPVRMAGNPWAYLNLESTLPGGIVALDLFAVDANGGCQEEPEGFTHMAGGAADLRFHRGNYEGTDFPVDEPNHVRMDLYNDAWTLQPGERFAVVVSGEGWEISQGQPYHPIVTLHGGTDAEASHIVVPLVEGTFGGEAPTLDYPPQPFLPKGVGE